MEQKLSLNAQDHSLGRLCVVGLDLVAVVVVVVVVVVAFEGRRGANFAPLRFAS
jgi:hypothetical protein